MKELFKQLITRLKVLGKYRRFPPLVELPFLAEADVNEQGIARILESSGAEVRIDEDGQLSVNFDGRCVNIAVWNTHRIIKLLSFALFKVDAKPPQIQHFINRLNTRCKLVKYTLISDDADVSLLGMSYCLPYSQGVTRDQLISVVAMFDAYAFDAAYHEDEDDILN